MAVPHRRDALPRASNDTRVPMYVLRPYQELAIKLIRQAIIEGHRRILLVIPTGGGKTVTAAELIDKTVAKDNKVIFLAHRQELIDQCSSKLEDYGVPHGIIQAKNPKRDRSLPVQVASIQTLVKRRHWPARLIVIDEAHRATAKTYLKICERYKDENPIILGLTATPYRMNGKPLGDLFDKLIDVVSVQELVDQGSLVNPTVYIADSPDLSKVKVGSNGDFRSHGEDSIEEAMGKTVLHGDIVENWVKFCGSRLGSHVVYERIYSAADFVQGDLFTPEETPTANPPQRVKYTDCDAKTVVFACSVKHSKMIVEQFKSVGVSAVHIDGESKTAERRRVLEGLKDGRISVVSQVGLLTEGWDLPALECVIFARATRSRSLYKQMGGRIMRPCEEARFKIIIDHGNCTYMHGRLTEPEIFSLEKSEVRVKKNAPKKMIRECPRCKVIMNEGTRVCQECGYEVPVHQVEHTSEILRELRPDDQVGEDKDSIDVEARQRDFNQLAAQCVEYGYKPAWARVRYQLKYDQWPSISNGIRTPRFFYEYEQQARDAQEKKKKAEEATRGQP